MLDLSNCSSLAVIPASIISRLSRLEELYLDNNFFHWDDKLHNQDEGNAKLAELNQLSHLTTLNICILDAQILPPNLPMQQLKRYTILIGNERNFSDTNQASTTLKLKLNNSIYLGYKSIKVLLERTEDLCLDDLGQSKNVLYELDEGGFPNLKYLHVQNSRDLLYIVPSTRQSPRKAFSMLEKLSLNHLFKLEKV